MTKLLARALLATGDFVALPADCWEFSGWRGVRYAVSDAIYRFAWRLTND